ncbi:hypothetical protein WN55_06626 [Dufourea novaeangliae]|uniref:Uncharacterized protein n=1 Tax=Dufourea novaeangliae TaxID=178035 RepID=A0A154PQK4_DUFNO|nr:hypothetical protein WN55_06626 [Dufourea novaeangliae]
MKHINVYQVAEPRRRDDYVTASGSPCGREDSEWENPRSVRSAIYKYSYAQRIYDLQSPPPPTL